MEASAQESFFFPIRTDRLMDNTQAMFDVYLLATNKRFEEAAPQDFIVYAKAPYKWTLRELNDLIKLGIQELYINNSHLSSYKRYLALKEDQPNIDNDLAPKFRIKQIQDVATHLLESCVLTQMDKTLAKGLHDTAQALVGCLLEDPQCILQIQTLCEHSIYTYIHSAGVAALAPAIALKMGETDKDMLTLYALSGLLHDIGKKDIPISILNKSGPLSADEWAIMKSHPEKGVEILDGFALSPMVIEAVGMHHEKLDGSGYVNGIGGGELSEWTKIITVADIFSALTTSRCYHFKRSRFEALMFMKHEMRGKIWNEAFEALVASLVFSDEEKKI